MGRKRKRPTTDYSRMTSNEVQESIAKLTAFLAERVARNARGDYRPMTDEEIEDILVAAGPRGYKKVFDDIVEFAAPLLGTDPTPAQPLQVDDAGALVADLDAWLAKGGAL